MIHNISNRTIPQHYQGHAVQEASTEQSTQPTQATEAAATFSTKPAEDKTIAAILEHSQPHQAQALPAGKTIQHLSGYRNCDALSQAPHVHELMELGIPVNEATLTTIQDYKNTPHFPPQFEELCSQSEEQIAQCMQAHGLKTIVHSEGPSVWAHIKLCLTNLERLPLEQSVKEDLKLILFFHDLGKPAVVDRPQNKEATENNMRNGLLMNSMKGHAAANLSETRQRLQATGIAGPKLELYQKMIAHHMDLDILERPDDAFMDVLRDFGDDKAAQQQALHMLAHILYLDAQSTEVIAFTEDGQAQRKFDDQLPPAQLYERLIEKRDNAISSLA